ncbi:lysosome membrane protein 2-like [Oppia nitens]|uniref:lysosome membrane protein 2-like n=1 Tax=Oppia nitens TaxID=1686743 RepID=UPI0023DAEF4A|nr:lysosome membrane protein 2-like [Oppia nitens]
MQLKSIQCFLTLIVFAMKPTISSLNGKKLRKCLTNKKFITGAVGLTLLILSIALHLSFRPLLKTLIQSKMNLHESSEFFRFWVNPSVPTEVGIYFFHILNPYDVQNGGKTIKVKEMGKYMFKQHYERQVIGFSDNLETVTFYERRYYVFDDELTTGSLDDNITVVNAPFAALGSIVPKVIDGLPIPPIFSSLPYRAVNSFLDSHQQTLFINTTVRDLLFGYKLDILDTAEGFANTLSRFGVSDFMPKEFFPNNSFGVLNGRNGTLDGPFEVYTGLSDTEDMFGYFKSWKSQTKLDYWKADSCNQINGTDGTIWPPFVDKTKRLYFYVPDVCRSLYVTFQEEAIHKGIKTYIYSAPDDVMAGKDTNPENECFCMNDNNDYHCRLDGVYDMSQCQHDIPIIVSLPHFIGGDRRITDRIEGLKPDPKLHRPVIHVEPTLGAVIHGDSKLQMSIRVPKNDYIRGFENLADDLYVPLFWGYKKLGISDDFASELKSRLFTPIIVVKYIIIMGMITGFSMLFIALLLAFLCQTQVLSISLIDDEFSRVPTGDYSSSDGTTTDTIDTHKLCSNRSSYQELELLMKTSPETII